MKIIIFLFIKIRKDSLILLTYLIHNIYMLVSIIIPYYKKQKFINKTIHSVLNQTYRNFEIIIVNDEPGHFQKNTYSFKKR